MKSAMVWSLEASGIADQVHLKKNAVPGHEFRHAIKNFHIAGMPVQQDTIYVNYDRKGNILIGMDILQNWNIHIGTSKVTGKNMFLACSENCVCQEFLEALEVNFGTSFLALSNDMR